MQVTYKVRVRQVALHGRDHSLCEQGVEFVSCDHVVASQQTQ